MSILITLPEGLIELKDASTTEDPVSHILTHNLNMKEIEEWLRMHKVAIQTIADAAITEADSGTTYDKIAVAIPVDLLDGQNFTDANGFKVSRLGVPAGGTSDSLEYTIEDTDVDRATNFQNGIGFGARELTGRIVYPTLIPNLTNIRVVFAHKSEMAATVGHVGPASTDPNVKVISWI